MSSQFISEIVVPDVIAPLEIAHGGRVLGNMDARFGDEADVLENRQRLYRTLGLQLHQVAVMRPANDGQTMVDLGVRKEFDIPTAGDFFTDAFITSESETGLAMNPADCNVIALSDGQTLITVHAGWRGAVENIASRVIEHASNTYGFEPSMAQAYFAPAIGQESYVSSELHPLQTGEAWEQFVQPVDLEDGQAFKIDLPGYLAESLVSNDIPRDKITLPSVDTGVDDSHFSYTRFQQDPQRSPNGRNGFVAVHKQS